jgi:hypothetical protein
VLCRLLLAAAQPALNLTAVDEIPLARFIALGDSTVGGGWRLGDNGSIKPT